MSTNLTVWWHFGDVHVRPKVVHEDGYATIVCSSSERPHGGEVEAPEHVGQSTITYEEPVMCRAAIAHDSVIGPAGVTARYFDGALSADEASVDDLGHIYVLGETAVRKASNAEGDQTVEYRIKLSLAVDKMLPLYRQPVSLLSGNVRLALMVAQGELPEVLQPKRRKSKDDGAPPSNTSGELL